VISPEDLERADEVFITSTTRDLLPVLSIERRPLCQKGRARAALQDAFRRYVDNYIQQHASIPAHADHLS
jgi:branched-chain amino acid aminotransferase